MLHLLSRLIRSKAVSASMTVEAAIVLPLFIAAMFLLFYPMRVMDAQTEVQNCMEHAGEIVSAAEGIKRMLPKSGKVNSQDVSSVLNTAETIYSGGSIFIGADMDVLGLPIITKMETPQKDYPFTEIHVTCMVNYPFSGLLGTHIAPIRLVSRRRAWVGREGGAGRNYEGSDGNTTKETEDEGDDTVVYVARNASRSGRYHTSASCHYISNTMSIVDAGSIDSLRSSDGGKYHACPSCKPGKSGPVYVFKSGNAFHSNSACKAIQSYAEEITLKEARGRGLTVCSYCSRSH